MTRGQRRWLLSLALVCALWPALAWAGALGLRVRPDCGTAELMAILAGAAAWQERVAFGSDLFARAAAPRIVLTDDGLRGGWSQAEQHNPLFVERAAAGLREGGVPADRIEILAPPVRGTAGEARRLRRHAAERGAASLLVVTSVYHGRRARLTYNRVFHDADATVRLCAAARGAATPSPATWWLSRTGWRDVGAEFPKLLVYAARVRNGGEGADSESSSAAP